MAKESTHSGIRARYCILDGDKVPFQAWRSEASSILDDADCLEIFKGTEIEPHEVVKNCDDENWMLNEAKVDQYSVDNKSFEKGQRRQ